MIDFENAINQVITEIDNAKGLYQISYVLSRYGFNQSGLISIQHAVLKRLVAMLEINSCSREEYYRHMGIIGVLKELEKMKPLERTIDKIVSTRAYNISSIVNRNLIDQAIKSKVESHGITVDYFMKSLFKYELSNISEIRSPVSSAIHDGWIDSVCRKVIENPERLSKRGSDGGYNKNKPGVFYVVHWKHKNGNEFLKYGISNDHEKRIAVQKHKTKCKPTVLFAGEFEDGKIAPSLENACHWRRGELYGMYGFISKEAFPDGYTETMDLDQYDWINEMLFENTMCQLKPLSKTH